MDKTLTIGFDAKRIMRNGTGLGNYCRTLVNDLALYDSNLQLRLYAPDMGKKELREQLETRNNMTIVMPHGKVPLGKVKGSIWRMGGIVKDLKLDGINIYHGLTGELPIGLKHNNIASIVTIHDLIFLRHPEYYNWIDTKLYSWKFRVACEEATRIVAISECTKRDIMEFGGVDENKIDVIYQSCGTRFKTLVSGEQKSCVRSKYSLPERYILFVGTIEERKNALLAVKALPLLPSDVHLVLVGRRTAYADRIDDYGKRNSLSDRIHFLSGVPTSDLYAIYQQAECFVYPSRYEGFGIPIVEAIQSGLPVVACTGSCLEEAGGPHSLYVSPDDWEGMATAIRHMLCSNPDRQQIIARSKEYVKRFENNDIASRMLELYHSVASISR